MAGEGRAPLPVVPTPFRDERLSSWLERIADVYLVSLDDLRAHVGWSRPALQLEIDPVQTDMERIAAATNSSVERLFGMTFHDAPSRYRSLLRPDAREICPVCSRGMQRPPRLRTWSFAFSFYCDRHRQPLQSPDTRGASVLSDVGSACRGAAILSNWAKGGETAVVPVDAAISLLLAPHRKPSPPAAWELARLARSDQQAHAMELSRPCPRPVLGILVPEFISAVPVYNQLLPRTLPGFRDAPFAERYAIAIGLARLLKNPAAAVARILEASDEFGREKAMVLIDRWPAAIRNVVAKTGKGRGTAKKLRLSRQR
ncbi:MAG: TniQ family protein, partial [Pseudaminobacter sp.]